MKYIISLAILAALLIGNVAFALPAPNGRPINEGGLPTAHTLFGTETLRRGDRGDYVNAIQFGLSTCNMLPDGAKHDGIFGPVTEKAVRALQADRNLIVDGLVGEKTKEVLKMCHWMVM